VWVTAVPLAWDVVVTLTASWQKVFSADAKLGFFAQRDKFQAALDQGKVLPPAKSIDQMHQVVTNSTVDGILAALFAILIIAVLLDAFRIWAKALRTREPLPLHEAAYEESKLVAPSGLIPTAEERQAMKEREPVGASRSHGP
jgi:carbon starvation protein